MAELAGPQYKSKKGSENKSGSGRQRAKPNIPTTVFGQALQAKISVGPARDRFEAEADRVADHVVGGSSGTPAISPISSSATQRKTNSKQEDELQRKTHSKKPEDELQRKTNKNKSDDELQREATAATSANASPSVEAGINAARGSGAPLAPAVLNTMENGFGRDFSSVRIHDDSRSHNLNQSLSSRAFTVGSDVFFSSGEYQPSTSSGSLLLAHELTHVVQQSGSGGIQTKRIQRNSDSTSALAQNDPPPGLVWPDPKNAKVKTTKGSIDLGSTPIMFNLPSLKLPKIDEKLKGAQTIGSVTAPLLSPSGPNTWIGKGERESGDAQAALWDAHLLEKKDQLSKAITTQFKRAPKIVKNSDKSKQVYYVRLKYKSAKYIVVIGTADELATKRSITRPSWDKEGKFRFMEVDHWREDQLGGAHTIDNFILLDKSSNSKSGNMIKNHVLTELNNLFKAARKDGFFTGPNKNADTGTFKSWPDGKKVNIKFASIESEIIKNPKLWDKEQISVGDHLKLLKPLTAKELTNEGFDSENTSPEFVNIFVSETASNRRKMKVGDGELKVIGGAKKNFIRGFDLESVSYTNPTTFDNGIQIGSLKGVAFGNRTIKVPGPKGVIEKKVPIKIGLLEIPIISKENYGFGGYIDRAYIHKKITEAAASLAGLSPIAFDRAEITDEWAMFAEGRVTADNPLFKGFGFAIRAEGNAIYLDAPIPVEKLKFDPFRVTEANLQVGFDKLGPFIGGDASFVIDGVGQGSIKAKRLSLDGKFQFDSDAFNPASISVAYHNGSWAVEADIGFKKDVIPGVQSGDVKVKVDKDQFSLDGTVNLAAPGIPDGTKLDVAYDKEKGVTIGSDIPLNTDAIPGVKSARVGVTVTRLPDGQWLVAGRGNAQIELPWVTGSLKINYDNGLLTIWGEGKVSRPPLTGSLKMTATNMPADEEGKPIEGPPLKSFRIFGTGLASIKFGKYITGSIGITLLENGEIELLGRIELPPEIPLIKATEWKYPILDFPEIRFPVIGLTVPVINKSFGVFGFVRGGIDAVITVGPGVLRDTAVEAIYNPDRPEEASITGLSQFDISASADLGLSVTGGIGAGLGIIEATGEVGIRAGLGLALKGGAEVKVNWTPTEGLVVDASVFGEARPKFSIDLIAKAAVVVDTWLWSGTLWSEEWDKELGSFGPDVFVRAELPASWSEKDGLDLDINKLKITKPNISIASLAGDIFDAVT